MSELSKQIAYLKGLAEGMKIAEKSDEGSMIGKLIEAMAAAADEIAELSVRCDDADEAITNLEENLEDIDFVVGELCDEMGDDEDNFSFDDDDDLFDLYDDDDDGLFEITCPECGEDVIVDFDMIDDENSIVCPNCHKDIELELDIDDDEEEAE